MSSTNTSRRFLSIAGRILLLLIAAIGVLQSGTLTRYYDPHGILFVLVGGIALSMISFPGSEIWSAFRHAAGGSGSEAELRNSAHFWEAAGRSFWILGGLRSVLSIIIGFVSMASQYATSMSALIALLIPSMLSTLYGSLLAVLCFIPCWKLLGIHQSWQSTPGAESSDTPATSAPPVWRFGTVLGYVLFLAVLVSTSRTLNPLDLWPVCKSALFVVLGGASALILFMGGSNTRLTPSAAFAGMGLIGTLMGFIQMLHGMTDPSPQGIAKVAVAIAFILVSCFTALLGMALMGGPLEDRAIVTGRVDAPTAFSRVSWYVFPLLSLIFMILVFINIIAPLPPG